MALVLLTSKPGFDNDMKHIAVLFEFPTLNGGEHSMLAVLEQLSQQADFCFTVLAPATGLLAEELERLKIAHRNFCVRDESGTRRPTEQLLHQLNEVLRSVSPDIVHANSLSMSRLLGQLSFDGKSPRRTGHLRDIIRLKKRVIGDLNNNDFLVAVSHATRDFHVSQGLDATKSRVIYNGVNTDLFQPRERLVWRSRLLPQVPPESTILLNVGQICLRKGQLDLAKAVCQLLQVRRDVHLVVLGKRHSAKSESVEYERQISLEFDRYKRTNHLHLPGHRGGVHQWMNAADLLVHTAHQEPFGRVLLEAAASGLPVLATNVGGTSEMLKSPGSATLISAGDSAALQSALGQLIDDPASRVRQATAARQRIENEFGLSAATSQLAEFWQAQ